MSALENILRFAGGVAGGDNALIRVADTMNPELQMIKQQNALEQQGMMQNLVQAQAKQSALRRVAQDLGLPQEIAAGAQSVGQLRDLYQTMNPQAEIREVDGALVRVGQDGQVQTLIESKKPAGFEGTSLEAQALNTYLNSLPPEQREAEKQRLAQQRLTRPEVYESASGMVVERPGYSLGALQSITEPRQQEQAQPEKSSFRPQFTRKERTDILSARSQLGKALENTEKLIKEVQEDPSLAGAVGLGRTAAESIGGAATDIADVLGVEELGNLGRKISGDADRQAARTSPVETSIATGLARARFGPGRLPVDEIQQARKNIQLRGLGSSAQALSRLQAVREELMSEMKRYEQQLGLEQPAEDIQIPDGGEQLPQQQGIDPELMQYMTPEERALFQ